MNMYWLQVLIGAIFEVFWVIGLKHAHDVWTWTGTAIAIAISFYALVIAGRHLPVGTVYAVFVGLGTAGTVLAELLFFGEPFRWEKLAMIFMLLVGVIGLKMATPDDREPETGRGG